MSQKQGLIFELEGTAIPKKPNGKPSKRVLEAIKRANDVAIVTFATSRSFTTSKPFVKLLGIKNPIVTLGGAQVFDPVSNKVIWEQDLDPGVPQKIVEIVQSFKGLKVFNYKTDAWVSSKTFKVKSIEPIISILATQKDSLELVKLIKKIPQLNVESVPFSKKGYVIVSVKHIYATKFMALQTIAKKVGLDPKKCIGVGDGTQDITLLNFCGMKIAMGNAASRLKELAQHIVPTIEQDGLAWVIEQFILA